MKCKIVVETTIFIPKLFDCITLKNNDYYYLYIFNKKTKLIIKLNKRIKLSDYNTFINFCNNYDENFNLIRLYNFIKNINIIHNITLKIKGKGYRIIKKKKLITLTLIHSHMNLVRLRRTLIKKIKKNRFIFLNYNFIYLSKLLLNIKFIRHFNMYTTCGLRIKRQLIFRRQGKTKASLNKNNF